MQVASLQACPDHLNVHIQKNEGPIILHTANCDNQIRNLGNECLGTCGNQSPGTCGSQQLGYYGTQHKQLGCCEVECTCVSKQSYAPYVYSGSVATYGGPSYYPVADAQPMVYCVCNSYGSNGYSNNCGGNQGSQGYPNYQGKYSGC